MVPPISVPFFLAIALPLYAVSVTQASSANTILYDAAVVGTNNIVELIPVATGLPSPTAILTNVEIVTCAPEEVCIESIFTDSAGQVTISIVAEFSVLSASIATALKGDVGARETTIAGSRTTSNAVNDGLSLSPTPSSPSQGGTNGSFPALEGSSGRSALSSGKPPVKSSTPDVASNQGLGGSNYTSSGITTAPSPTVPVSYAIEVTNSQGSVTDEVVEVTYHSGVPSTSVMFAYADSVTTTETGLPAGVSIQTIITSTCTTAGAIVTTTSSGSIVETEVPEICTNGFAFLIFGLPGFDSSSDWPSLCHKLFSFPFGIEWRVFCPGGTPPTISIISVDPGKLPGKDPDRKSSQNHRPSGITPSQATPSHTTASQTQSTVSSSAAVMPTRYVVMPLMNTTQSATDSLFASYAQRKNVTEAKRSDGSLEFFALELSDSEASTINGDPHFIIIQESQIGIGMPDTGQMDSDINRTSYATEPLDSFPDVGSRDLHDKTLGPRGGGLFRRVQSEWTQKLTTWTLAMISLVPGLTLPVDAQGQPGYRHQDEDSVDYPYWYNNAIKPGENVRVYLIDTGLNMLHPEFNGRLKPGITNGQTQDDWDIDWLFPRVDDNEWFEARSDIGSTIRQRYEYNYIDPDSRNPNGGIHPAYTDFRVNQAGVTYGRLTPHGTRVSAFIIGDELGQAQKCRFTVVKLPQYTNGPRAASGVLFPLFAAKDALNMIAQDIMTRKDQGEELFVVSSSCGYVFSFHPGYNPFSAEPGFIRLWEDFLQWLDEEGVNICASAGNTRQINAAIDLVPARLFKRPEIVVGSVTPQAIPHPDSQGWIGDGILTAYAPAAGALVVSSTPDGAYIYEWFAVAWSSVTSYGT